MIEVCDGTYKIRRQWTIIDWCLGTSIEVARLFQHEKDQSESAICGCSIDQEYRRSKQSSS